METFYSAESKWPAESEGWSDGFLEIVIVSKMFSVRLVFRSCFMGRFYVSSFRFFVFFFFCFSGGVVGNPCFCLFFQFGSLCFWFLCDRHILL